MSADFDKPSVTSTKTSFPAEIRDNDSVLAQMFHNNPTASNKPTNAKRIDNNGDVYYWSGSAWVSIGSIGASQVSDTAYGSSWDGVTGDSPSKNAVYDKIESLSGTDVYYVNASGSGDEDGSTSGNAIACTDVNTTIDFDSASNIRLIVSGLSSSNFLRIPDKMIGVTLSIQAPAQSFRIVSYDGASASGSSTYLNCNITIDSDFPDATYTPIHEFGNGSGIGAVNFYNSSISMPNIQLFGSITIYLYTSSLFCNTISDGSVLARRSSSIDVKTSNYNATGGSCAIGIVYGSYLWVETLYGSGHICDADSVFHYNAIDGGATAPTAGTGSIVREV